MGLTEEQRTRVGTCVGIITAKGEYLLTTSMGVTLEIHTDNIKPPTFKEFNKDIQTTLKNYEFHWGERPDLGWTTYICFDNDEETQAQYWERIKKGARRMGKVLIEHRRSEDCDWSELYLDGQAIGDEYQVDSQATAVCHALSLLGIDHEYKYVQRHYDDIACEWGEIIEDE